MHILDDLYLDLDGVFADYEGEYKRLTGGDPSEKGKNKFNRFRNFPHFYRDLPLLPNAMKLWNFVKQYHPKFLSAASNYLKTSREDKELWVHQYFDIPKGPRVIICNYPQDKWKYAKPGAVLIDDKKQNCEDWVRAGGIAIHHKTVDETIRQLQILMKHHDAAHVVEALTHVETSNVVEAFEHIQDAPPVPNVTEAFDSLWKMIEAGHDINSEHD
jgi:5'(3')-deoxyribonucleotidase